MFLFERETMTQAKFDKLIGKWGRLASKITATAESESSPVNLLTLSRIADDMGELSLAMKKLLVLKSAMDGELGGKVTMKSVQDLSDFARGQSMELT